MPQAIGIFIQERIAAAAVSDHKIEGEIRVHPQDRSVSDFLQGMPAEQVIEEIVGEIRQLTGDGKPACIGVGIPGIVRQGTIEDSPNLVQLKGLHIKSLIEEALKPHIGAVPVSIFNDADTVAAGIAATQGHLDRLIRVWTLGNGIGYGRYPVHEGVWEAGHSVVTLDPKEQFCGCGGRGHLEGIMGHRAMRLRFMDLEPEEVFAQAEKGEGRCVDFVRLWHRALAAATATSIHQDGPGKFYITGYNAQYMNLTLLEEYLHEMVKLSPLQGYALETVAGGEHLAVIGAAVNALQAAGIS